MSLDWASPTERERALAYLDERFGIPAAALDGHRLLRRGDYLYAVREEVAACAEPLQVVAAGLKLLKAAAGGGQKPATRGMQVFGRWATRCVCDVEAGGLAALLQGRALPWHEGGRGPVLVRTEGAVMGVGLLREGQLLGQFPRSMTEHLRL